jgi:O-antigen ligase
MAIRAASAEESGELLWFSAARWLLVLTLMGAPLAFGTVQSWAWGALEASTFLVFLLWLVGSVAQGEFHLVWSPLYLPGILFLLLGGIQLAFHFTFDWTSTREALLKLSLDLLLFFLATALLAGGSYRTLRGFGWAVCAYAFILSMFALLQLFSTHDRIYWAVQSPSAPLGPYVNRNDYAGLMEILVPVAGAYVALRRVNFSIRLLLGFMVLIPVVSVFVSGSRGGVLSLCGEALIVGLTVWRAAPRQARRSLLVTAAASVVIVVVVAASLLSAQASQRLAQAVRAGNTEPSIGARLHVARDSLRILKDHPWIGTGMGSFEVVFPEYQTSASDLLWDHAHDDYAEALAETGLAGGLLIAGGLVLFVRLAFADLRSRLVSRQAWIQLGAAAGCCGLLIHSLIDFNLHVPANAAWLAVAAAVACGSRAGHRTETDPLAEEAEGLGRN